MTMILLGEKPKLYVGFCATNEDSYMHEVYYKTKENGIVTVTALYRYDETKENSAFAYEYFVDAVFVGIFNDPEYVGCSEAKRMWERNHRAGGDFYY
jgi:hypothetical protein